eukprot:TRINITY_DN23057_c0_g1_i1.p1 TRINITY_DN23057_c0_g1~~TRINITY_DN23057_c0_g1_i1.p1  ORF type:complete len:109 (-),score=12.58 TRINITY_DN23057_c0_g1_i1:8-334(-)
MVAWSMSLRDASHSCCSIPSFRSSPRPRSTSMASCEVGDRALRLLQNFSLSSARSSSKPWALALLQKYRSHACKKVNVMGEHYITWAWPLLQFCFLKMGCACFFVAPS